MLATKKGIEINRAELWALLAFTGDGEQHSCVHFRVNGSARLEAAATDGKRAVECIGKADGALPGEWAIDAEFLELCRNACDAAEKSILLRLSSSGLRDAHVVAEDGEMIAPVGWHRAASSTQITMGELVRGLRVPTDARHTGSWCAIDPVAVLRGLSRVRVAASDCPITIYPPKDPTAPLMFECRSERGQWRGAVVPEKVIGPGSEADDPPDEDEGAPGRPDRQTRLDLAARANGGADPDAEPEAAAEAEADGIIDDEEAERIREGLPTAKKRRKSKKTSTSN